MTARKRTDAEPLPELPEETPQPDYGGLGTMIAREIAVEARRARARREFYKIEHVNPTVKGASAETKFLGLYRVTGENRREYDVLIRDPNPEHHVNRCSCLDYESNNLGTCKHVEAVLGWIRRKYAPQIRAARPRLEEINRLTVYITMRYVNDGTWVAAPVYDHALDPGLMRLLNYYLIPYLHQLEDEPDTFLKRLERFLQEVEDFGGKAVVEPEVYDYAATVKNRAERDARRRELMSRVEAGQARLDLLKLPLYPYQAVGTLFLAFTERALLADDMGLGKAQPLTAKVLTPLGWTLMGDIQVGDEVINSQGETSRVVGVFPQGVIDIYRVEFSDGSETECCGDHLWLVNTALRRRRGNAFRTLSLRDLRGDLCRTYSGIRQYQHFVPLVRPVHFVESELPLHPYLLGVLIGDGGLSDHTVRLSSADSELVERVRGLLPEAVRLEYKSGYDWSLTQGRGSRPNAVTVTLRSLGLMGHHAEQKFIPEILQVFITIITNCFVAGIARYRWISTTCRQQY